MLARVRPARLALPLAWLRGEGHHAQPSPLRIHGSFYYRLRTLPFLWIRFQGSRVQIEVRTTWPEIEVLVTLFQILRREIVICPIGLCGKIPGVNNRSPRLMPHFRPSPTGLDIDEIGACCRDSEPNPGIWVVFRIRKINSVVRGKIVCVIVINPRSAQNYPRAVVYRASWRQVDRNSRLGVHGVNLKGSQPRKQRPANFLYREVTAR